MLIGVETLAMPAADDKHCPVVVLKKPLNMRVMTDPYDNSRGNQQPRQLAH